MVMRCEKIEEIREGAAAAARWLKLIYFDSALSY